jgi:hypothetical protein
MANQKDTYTVDDLDLSGIEGWNGSDDSTPIEAPIETPEVEAVEAVEAPVESEAPVEEAAIESAPAEDGPISWSSVEKLVPEPLHEDLKPMVEEWRRQYERVLDETNPYRKYSELGVTDKDIEQALSVQKALLEDPKRFYEGLGDAYGWNQPAPAPTPAAPKAAAPASDSYFSDWDVDAETAEAAANADPRLIAAIEEQQARLAKLEEMQTKALEEAEQVRVREMGRVQLESELETLESKYGSFDRAEVVKRAVANAAAGGDPSVAKAFHELKDYEEKIRKQFVSSRPPRVMGSGTGITPPAPVDLSSDEAKREAALALAIRLGASDAGVR